MDFCRQLCISGIYGALGELPDGCGGHTKADVLSSKKTKFKCFFNQAIVRGKSGIQKVIIF